MSSHIPLPPLPFSGFPDSAKVWIYQTGRSLEAVNPILSAALDPFVSTWKSHGADVRGAWALYAGAFVLVVADEHQSGVSGCSTDGLVRVMQQLSLQTGQDFFNRTACGLFGPDGLGFLPLSSVKKGELPTTAEDLFYADLTPATLADLRTGWPVPLLKSWIPLKTLRVW